jgi:CrcB protein
MWTWAAVAGFGLVGIFSRYGLDLLAISQGFARPLITLLINVVGSFVAGFLMGHDSFGANSPWRVGLVVGFCGGFTTFSGFSLHLLELVQRGEANLAFTLGLATTILCFVGVCLGYLLARQLPSF